MDSRTYVGTLAVSILLTPALFRSARAEIVPDPEVEPQLRACLQRLRALANQDDELRGVLDALDRPTFVGPLRIRQKIMPVRYSDDGQPAGELCYLADPGAKIKGNGQWFPPGTFCGGPHATRNSSVIYWPQTAVDSTDTCGGNPSFCETLLHELKHAYNIQEGRQKPFPRVPACNDAPRKFSIDEEKDALRFGNKLRTAPLPLGDGKQPRCCYAGCTLDVPGCSCQSQSQFTLSKTALRPATASPAACAVCPPDRLATNGKCAPAVLFTLSGALLSNPNGINKPIFIRGDTFDLTETATLRTGFAYVHFTAAEGRVSGDIDVKYAGADGTINLDLASGVTAWFANPGKSFTFRRVDNWTLNPFTFYNGRTTSGTWSFQASRTAPLGCNVFFPEYPGVCYRWYSEFPVQVSGGFDRITQPQFIDTKMKAHFDVSVEFVP